MPIYFFERQQGTLTFFVLSPSSKFTLMMKKIPIHIADSFLTVLIGLSLFSVTFNYHFPQNSLWTLLIISLTGTISLSFFGMMISAFGLFTRDINILLGISETLILILSGVNFNVNKLPFPLPLISKFLPLSNTVKAVEFTFKNMNSSAVICISWEIIIGLSYLAASFLLIKTLEGLSRKNAKVDIY